MMTANILVTYSNRAGSTAGVAVAIAEILNQHGLPAEVVPMNDVRNLSGYSAVIAGSPIQAAKWLPEAIHFLNEQRPS